MAEYRYYLIPDFMSHVFPQQFEEQAPTEFFSNTADLMKLLLCKKIEKTLILK